MLKMEWNKEKSAMVLLTKIKEVSITNYFTSGPYTVKGWYNKENAFVFGDYLTLDEARAFVSTLRLKMKMAWNRHKTAAVVLNRVKEYTINQNLDKNYDVRGWFNKENNFLFGDDFETLPMAQRFLDDINSRI